MGSGAGLGAPGVNDEWDQRRQVAGRAVRVGIGELVTSRGDAVLRATLGSCVGVCLVHPRYGTFALAHVLLPRRSESAVHPNADPARFAESVIPHMLLGFEDPRGLVAYVAGGAALYGGARQREGVGEDNREVILAELASHRLRVVGQDFGGSNSRQIVVDGARRSVYTLVFDKDGTGHEWAFPATFSAAAV